MRLHRGTLLVPISCNRRLQIEISMLDGSTKSLRFVAQNGGDKKSYYVQSPSGDETFMVYDYVVTNLVKKPEELK